MKFLYFICAALLIQAAKSLPNRAVDDYDPNFGANEDGVLNDYEYEVGADLEDENEDNQPAPLIVSKPKSLEVTENETLTLPCETKNADGVVILWKKDDTTIFQDSLRFSNEKPNLRVENSSLVISNVSGDDAGMYVCSLALGTSKNPEVMHKLIVRTSPKIVKVATANDQTQFEAGKPLVLYCEASGYPVPKVIWSVDGNDKRRYEGDTLQIHNITHADAGEYQCLADNNIGLPAHQSIQILVKEKPRVHIKQLTVNTAQNFESEFICQVHGVPVPIVNWQRDGKNIVKSDNINLTHEGHAYKLQIKNTQESDFGEYACSAVNSLGRTTKVVVLNGVPSVAQFVKGDVAEDKRSPYLEWTVESNKPIDSYVLEYKERSHAKWIMLQPAVTPPNAHVYTLKHTFVGLGPGQYEARVKSKNEYGWSAMSKAEPFKGEPKHAHKSHHRSYNQDHTVYTQDKNNAAQEQHQQVAETRNLKDASKTTDGSAAVVPSVLSICVALTFLKLYRH